MHLCALLSVWLARLSGQCPGAVATHTSDRSDNDTRVHTKLTRALTGHVGPRDSHLAAIQRPLPLWCFVVHADSRL